MSWVAIGGAAVTVVGGYMANKSKKKAMKDYNSAEAKQDPFGPYRPGMAAQLNTLVNDPSTVTDSGAYKARMQAAQRTMAAQGYTGSGNALLAAANAGGDAYQQAFNNLSLLAGAGQAPGSGAMNAAQGKAQSRQNAYDQYGNAANNLMYYGQKALGSYQQNQAWNSPIDIGSTGPDVSFNNSMDPINYPSEQIDVPNIPPVSAS